MAAVVLELAIALPREAAAQRPVCPPPMPDHAYYAACLPALRIPTARFLAEFTVDHLFKGSTFAFLRRPVDVARVFDPAAQYEEIKDLRGYLEAVPAAEFTRLDSATGLFELEAKDARRAFAAELEMGGQRYDVSWRLPARAAGGYWRTPGTLQLTFWEGHRLAVEVNAPERSSFRGELGCVVVSSDGIRAITADPDTPDLLVLFDDCPAP